MTSRNPPPWQRKHADHDGARRPAPSSSVPAKRPASSQYDQPSKRTTNAQEDAWAAEEDRFVLQQAKKKAALRVKGGRATPIDWLAVTLRFVDPTKTLLDEEVEDHELDVVDPEGVLEGLDKDDLSELEKEIDNYLALETDRSNRDYWKSLKTVCKDRQRKSHALGAEARGTNSVSADIDRLLAPKTYEQLETLEAQVKRKLDSDEPIDYDYWEQLLRNLRVWKAKARLGKVSREILGERLQTLRKQQEEVALSVQKKVEDMLTAAREGEQSQGATSLAYLAYDESLDPQPTLKLRAEEKALEQVEEKKFIADIANERRKVLKLGYVPMNSKAENTSSSAVTTKVSQVGSTSASRFAPVEKEDYSRATMALYEREVARGVDEGEEVFAAEEEVRSTKNYQARKPRYFNRVQMGYEWNKYNQTHYDHDNPPPKVVQGYKFNIFYPDLIDKAKAPSYKIERENGRKRGESFAPAGEDDTCLIRFIAGPPYADIAFRIVDKEWDYSAKRDRGFKSSFDKGILQLHFQFKKIYYRK
ncbi:hypothetical protein P280DRAFT_172088 [Massarina eburnea CBS 473.64]|uniref:Splicing factor Cactin n=1 Tax=Massarina eburnea CBS 473.64 TaxID=1395130 RepID=A0A6A6SCL9_9PLEO|nr:hypothetical protein P280DRAFT_172088 [Massarina eburnea CBS 473.64]